jgi:hydroxylamine dehydrogenase
MDNRVGNPGGRQSWRALIFGLITVVLVLGFVLVVLIIQRSQGLTHPPQADALASSSDACVTCHRSATPGIVGQYGTSEMAAAKVTCRDCHEVSAGYAGSTEHEGVIILAVPTSAKCGKCHAQEVAQFDQSRHSLPAYVAYAGSKDLSPALLAMYQAIPEAQASPDKARNAIFVMEGADITPFACEVCHSVGKPQPDGSIGKCSTCHLRHTFSLEQVRKPETCSACHIGPDHPQWEIYQESAHGILYSANGQDWNWQAEPGTLTAADFPAPTCATCHFSGFGTAGTTHDTGDRLTWFLASQVSARRPSWQDNLARMQTVCLECHNQNFVDDYYTRADKAVAAVNALVQQSDAIMQPVTQQNLLTGTPFDQPIEFTYYELWHHYGRTAKFGVWMQGADYTQWHGAYEIEKGLAELQDQASQMLQVAAK